MTRSIFKYEIPTYTDESAAPKMHRGAELLWADGIPEPIKLERYGIPRRLRFYVWALVDLDAPEVARRVGVFLTGDSVPDGLEHVASFRTEDSDGSPFLGHVFDGGEA